jgi:hypothetical protein
MICRLCQEDTTLLKNSHIIPNFLYKGLFDEKHKIVNVNLNDFSDATFHQTGFKDKDILCAECDNVVIGKHERYASNTIYGNHDKLDIEIYEGNAVVLPYVRFKNLDYTSIKLFFLSILWKSHISKNPFFNQIDLGSKYSEQLRQMILNNDAGPEDAFEVILVRPETKGSRPTKSMIAPRRLKADGNTAYLFHINEIMYHFNVSKHNKMSIFNTSIIKKDGIIDIAIAKNEWGTGYFDSFIGQKIPINSKSS